MIKQCLQTASKKRNRVPSLIFRFIPIFWLRFLRRPDNGCIVFRRTELFHGVP